MQCDHSKDDDIKALFERVSQEQEGQLDVLVNNAYSGVKVCDKDQMNEYDYKVTASNSLQTQSTKTFLGMIH